MRHFILFALSLSFLSMTQEKARVLYRAIDPTSIPEHLAYYSLFKETPEGKKALKEAWQLLSGDSSGEIPFQSLPADSIASIVTLITKAEGVETNTLSQEDLHAIQLLSKRLPNKQLPGYRATSESEVLTLPTEEVDLSKGLLLAQATEDPNFLKKASSYEALIDLMALQILTKVGMNATPEEKIDAMNRFIFDDMGYRFPPHSVYIQDVDLYTYLPSVIDSRRGVCLGVSILYLALSQRLNLPLEIVTPPGHIYVRYHQGDKTINIETTARGIHLDSEEYMGIESKALKTRSMKEVIGMAFFNEASVHWQNQNYERALRCYEKANLYMPNDPLLMQLMAFNYLFVGDVEKGRSILAFIHKEHKGNDELMQEDIIEDFLNGKVDIEGIRNLFLFVTEKRESLLKKKEALQKTLSEWPQFRAGYFHLAVTWLQLHRMGNALKTLEKYHEIDKTDPNAQYLLAELYAMRSNYPKAWEHLHNVEELLKSRPKLPKTLSDFHRTLAQVAPE